MHKNPLDQVRLRGWQSSAVTRDLHNFIIKQRESAVSVAIANRTANPALSAAALEKAFVYGQVLEAVVKGEFLTPTPENA